MKQIKAHIAVSLDGHTATPDYELDWLPREIKISSVNNTWKRIACLWGRTPTITSLNTGAGGRTKASGLCGVTLRHQCYAGLRRGVPDRRTAAKGL